MTNNGLLVKIDRFLLTDRREYLLEGWLVPETNVTASLDGEPVDVRVQTISDSVDEKYGGCEVRVFLHLDQKLSEKKVLKIYADGPSGRHLAFDITGRELFRKQQDVRYFIDEATIEAGQFRIQGWAAAKKPVKIELLHRDGTPVSCKIERYLRYDTKDLFYEYDVGQNCGFYVKASPVPKGGVVLRLSDGRCTLKEYFPTDPAAIRMKRIDTLIQKGKKTLKYKGIGAFWTKTYNRLFNPNARPVHYSDWIKKHLPSDKELARERNVTFDYAPKISIVVPCYKSQPDFLRALVDSVRKQTYGNWELILSDGSGDPSPMDGLLDELEASDKRIRTVRNHKQLRISDNTNAAIAVATGEFISFSDHDDLLVESALYEVVKRLNQKKDTDLIYTDEDKITTSEELMQPNMKPDYDPDLLCSVNYICHLLTVRKSLVDKIGGLDPDFDGAQDYNFIFHCVERTTHIEHIPKVLYHWRYFEGSTAANPESKDYAFTAGQRAIQAHYDRLKWPATVEPGPFAGIYRTHWHWKEEPLVSVLIPNKDHTDDLDKCLKSISRESDYPNLEIIVIENNSTEPETFAYYEKLEKEDPRVRVVHFKGEFNYSKINNFGASFAKGEYLLLLNNDTEMINDAIREMLGYAMRPDVGACGARLYFGDNTIQHAGVIMGWGGVAGHAFVNQKRDVSGYQHRIILQQDYSAVTAACMMVRKSSFDEVGGFTEELAVAFNDMDFCMKLRSKGYLIVYNPYAELYHYESKSRGAEDTPEKVRRFNREIKIFQNRWPDILKNGDPYYSPNLSMITQDFSLKRI